MNTSNETQWIDVGLIDVPEYSRTHSTKAIEALAADMAKNGQLQNTVVVKGAGERYELVIGKGRLQAAKKLGWDKIRADVKEGMLPLQKLAIIAAENEAREDACPFYTAMLYGEMRNAAGLTQQELAEQIGRDQSYVSLYMKLAQVPREIWNDHQPDLTSLRLCLEIAKAKDAEHQKMLVEAAAKDGLGTAALKKLAKKLKGEGETATDTPATLKLSWKGTDLVVRGRLSVAGKDQAAIVQEITAAVAAFLSNVSPQEAVPQMQVA